MAEQGARPARPGRARLWLKRGCGCSALALVALLALLAFLPALAGGAVASAVERGFAARHRGRLELPKLERAWRARQCVDGAILFDPDGARVASASADAPSLLSLARAALGWRRGERCELGRIEIEVDADLAVDADGTSNLSR